MRAAPPQSFELVLLDPPFDSGLLVPALQAAAALLVDGGYAYVESPAPVDAASLGFEAWRSARAGAVHFALLRHGYTARDTDRSAP